MVRFRQKTNKEHLIIGIAGTSAGLGVTHLCITLANYTASKQRKKTACLELTDAKTFEQLGLSHLVHNKKWKDAANRYFTIHDVDYYPNVQKGELPLLINSGYEILILDFGTLNHTSLDELLRCDRKFLLCSHAPWRNSELSSCLSAFQTIHKMEFLLYLINYGSKLDLARLALDCSIPYEQLRSVPFLQNPFHIEKEWFSFFEKLLLL